MSKLQLSVNIVFGALLAFLIYSHFTQSQKVVYVDSTKLLNEYEGMIAARKDFQVKASGWQANVDTLAAEIKAAIATHEKTIAGMTPKERQLSQELLKTKQNQLEQYQQALSTQAQQEDRKMTTEVLSQVNAYIKKFGAQKGYVIIFAATDYGNIAYAKDGLDVTEEVLAGLNAEFNGK